MQPDQSAGRLGSSALRSLSRAETLRRLKDQARLAFAAFQEAAADGDPELEAAAKARFVAASEALRALGPLIRAGDRHRED